MTNDTQETTVVLGGTGKIGGRVVQRLRAEGADVRVGSRRGDPPFDWDDRSTWGPVLSGATSAFVSFAPDLAIPGAADVVGALAAQAVDGGVRRLVLLSGRGEPQAQRAERLVQDAGAEWTIVRCAWFSQGFSESFLLDGVLAGEVVLPVDGVAEPFVDADDVADVAAAALTQDGHAGRRYELTGPRLLRFDEAVAEIARAAGREVRFAAVGSGEYAAALAADHVPGDVAALLTYLFAEVLDGRNAHLADGVQRALGRAPREFADYARAAAASGVWNGAGDGP